MSRRHALKAASDGLERRNACQVIADIMSA